MEIESELFSNELGYVPLPVSCDGDSLPVRMGTWGALREQNGCRV